MSDTGLIALRTFSDVCRGGVGKVSSDIGTLIVVSGWISSGIAVNVGGGVGTLGAGVGFGVGTLVGFGTLGGGSRGGFFARFMICAILIYVLLMLEP